MCQGCDAFPAGLLFFLACRFRLVGADCGTIGLRVEDSTWTRSSTSSSTTRSGRIILVVAVTPTWGGGPLCYVAMVYCSVPVEFVPKL